MRLALLSDRWQPLPRHGALDCGVRKMDPATVKDDLLSLGVGGIVVILVIREVFAFVSKYRRNGRNGAAPIEPRINWFHEFKELRTSQSEILHALQSNQTVLISTLTKLESTLANFDPSVKPADVMVEVEVNRKKIDQILTAIQAMKTSEGKGL